MQYRQNVKNTKTSHYSELGVFMHSHDLNNLNSLLLWCCIFGALGLTSDRTSLTTFRTKTAKLPLNEPYQSI